MLDERWISDALPKESRMTHRGLDPESGSELSGSTMLLVYIS